MRRPLEIAVLLSSVLAVACTPQIGDGCQSSIDCSINGDRQCDTSAPDGLCTVYGCEADTCPDNAVCVRWRPDPTRLTFTACMKRCSTDGNCRQADSFRCVAAGDITTTETGGDVIAEVVDEDRNDDGRFCVATEPEPVE